MGIEIRPRINRWTLARRELNFSQSLINSLVQPHFVVDGTGIDSEIKGMPGIHRQSIDVLIETIKSDFNNGIRSIMLFGVIDSQLKDDAATQASNPSSPLHRAVAQIKQMYGDRIVVMTDVCLCTATAHGHCGLVEDGEILNDESLQVLCEVAISHAKAGADYVCASDMMDGRVEAIRKALEAVGKTNTGIMAYSVKYASSFYGPFRNAASSSPEFGDRKTHQMDIKSGYKEAILEAQLDQNEGADIIMVKPGLPYLDVVRKVSDSVNRPVAVYNVSGEYSMVVKSSVNDEARSAMVNEIFTSFRRAGADIIVSYHAREFAERNSEGGIK
ncbi:MAG: porphobilinogen synthase [Euryarchaeota archaeon]|nr:porphobilinogen synthase [Euryarchaeota archaeon]|tara:strand:+ start:596 stop:1585 length:990 start_codon:yes stop_codon:yes gene_type:complete